MVVENLQEEGKDQGGREEDNQSSGGAQPAASSNSMKAYGQGPQTQWGQKGQGVRGHKKGGQEQRSKGRTPAPTPKSSDVRGKTRNKGRTFDGGAPASQGPRQAAAGPPSYPQPGGQSGTLCLGNVDA